MENFKVNEYFKDYVAINKTYFGDLKNVTKPKVKNGSLTSIVLLNEEKYEKIEWIKDNLIHILFSPVKTYQTSPAIELITTDNFISVETFKLVKGTLLEYKQYGFAGDYSDKVIYSFITTEYFDISDEIVDKRYLFKTTLEKGLEGKICKKMVGKKSIGAKRNEETIECVSSLNENLVDVKVVSNKDISLFELLSEIDNEITKESKTK